MLVLNASSNQPPAQATQWLDGDSGIYAINTKMGGSLCVPDPHSARYNRIDGFATVSADYTWSYL